MPIYEYECERCGEVDEFLQKISDKPLTKCKKCSGKLHKLMSQNSFHLKGSGWYVTDYASKKSLNQNAKESKKTEPEESTPESTKPADSSAKQD
jgi:putative FmdB family regulatory protein